MSKKYNYVYVTTNLVTLKKYVGSHCTDNIDDGYLGTGRLFLKSVKKHGKENFRREILEECFDVSTARLRESFYIETMGTLDPSGYNLCPHGGIGFKGASHSEATKEKMSKWQKGKTYEELYGPEKAAEMKRKMSEAKKGRTTPRKGKGHLKEMIEKYGDEEGLRRYKEFLQKQRESHIGKKQSKDHIDKRMESMGEVWNKGKTYELDKNGKPINIRNKQNKGN